MRSSGHNYGIVSGILFDPLPNNMYANPSCNHAGGICNHRSIIKLHIDFVLYTTYLLILYNLQKYICSLLNKKKFTIIHTEELMLK